MGKMKVVVCGGRKYRSPAYLFLTLNKLHAELHFTDLMQGGADGADALAREWACTHPEITRHVCRAAWTDLSHPDAVIRRRRDGTQYDAKAGHRRNARMVVWLLQFPEDERLLVSFPGEDGTADMKRQARAAGIKVTEA